MVIQVQTERPRDADPDRDDARCAGWAADGECAAHPEFMRCVCGRACARARIDARAAAEEEEGEEEGGGGDEEGAASE